MDKAGNELSWTAIGIMIALALGGIFITWVKTSGKGNEILDKIMTIFAIG